MKEKYKCKKCEKVVVRGDDAWHPKLELCGRCYPKYQREQATTEVVAVNEFLAKELTPEVMQEFWAKAFADTTESKTALTQAIITDLIIRYRYKMAESPKLSLREILDQLREWIKVYIVLKGEIPLPAPITIYGSAEFTSLEKRIKGRYERKKVLEDSGDPEPQDVGDALPGVGEPVTDRP